MIKRLFFVYRRPLYVAYPVTGGQQVSWQRTYATSVARHRCINLDATRHSVKVITSGRFEGDMSEKEYKGTVNGGDVPVIINGGDSGVVGEYAAFRQHRIILSPPVTYHSTLQ